MRHSAASSSTSQGTSTPNTITNGINQDKMAEIEQPCSASDCVLETGLAQANKEQAEGTTEDNQQQTEPYCAFTKSSKLFIVITVSVISFFSPFSINIYIPALPQISHMLHTSEGE